MPHNLIKEKLTELIEQTFNREGSLYLACNDKNAFFTSEQPKRYKLWSCQKMCDALHYLLDNIFIRFGSKFYRQIVGIPIGISEPIFNGDLVYKFKRIVGKPNFSDQFKKIVKRYIRVGYNLDIMRQSACLVLNPITVYSYGFLFNCTTVGQASDSLTALT